MGAHVWGPAYLRDHLLPHGRLVGLDARLVRRLPRLPVLHGGPVAADRGRCTSGVREPAARAGGRCSPSPWRVGRLVRARAAPVPPGRCSASGSASLVLVVPVPYGVAFKLVTVVGPRRRCRSLRGRSAGWPTCRSRARRSLAVGVAVLPLQPRADAQQRHRQHHRRQHRLDDGRRVRLLDQPAPSASSTSAFLLRGLRTGRHRAARRRAARPVPGCATSSRPSSRSVATALALVVVARAGPRLRWLLADRSRSPALLARVLGRCRSCCRRAYLNDMGWEKLPTANAMLLDGETPQHLWHYLGQSTPCGVRRCCGRSPLVGVGWSSSVVYRIRPGCSSAGHARGRGAGLRAACPRAGSGTPGCCPSTSCASSCSPASASAEVIRAVATLLARDPERPGPVVGAVGAPLLGLAAPCSSFLGAARSACLPGGDVPGERRRAAGSGSTAATATTCRAGPSGTTTGLERKGRPRTGQKAPSGQGGYPEYHGHGRHDGRARRGPRARLRPGHVGVRRPARQLRHADGADAAAVLDRRLHRLDGGPLLRGVGHHAVPLPQPVRAVRQAARARSATCPTARFDIDLRRPAAPAAGRPLLPRLHARRRSAAADADDRPHRGGRRRARGTSTSSRRRASWSTPLDNEPVVLSNVGDDPGRVARPGGRLVPGPDPLGRAARRRRARRLAAGRRIPAEPDRARPTATTRAHRRAATCPTCPTEAVTPAAGHRHRDRRRPHLASTSTGSGSPVLVKVSYFPNWQAVGRRGPVPGHAEPDGRGPDRASTSSCTTAGRRSTAWPSCSRCSASAGWSCWRGSAGRRDARARRPAARRRPGRRRRAAGRGPARLGRHVPVPTRPADPDRPGSPLAAQVPPAAEPDHGVPTAGVPPRPVSAPAVDRSGAEPRCAGSPPSGWWSPRSTSGCSSLAGPGRRAGRCWPPTWSRSSPRPCVSCAAAPGRHLRRRPVRALGPRTRSPSPVAAVVAGARRRRRPAVLRRS